MRGLTKWVLVTFASPIGVLILAALDSTIFVSLPLGIDAVVIILAARLGERAWLAAALATIGSLAGAAVTFWMGRKIGDAGLERYVPARRLEAIRSRVRDTGAVTLAVLSLIPPPCPFTLVLLAAGALEVKARTFFGTLGVVRLLRFGIEAWLAVLYGRRIVKWLDSDLFQGIAAVFIALAVALTVLSIVRVVRSTRRPLKHSAA